ncbi:MAG TPA: sulfotransferase [Candidatus Acidoferrales bacterium]|nr:sulfotransferase [Candidatus Acidoferrales bacterium]
MSSVRVTRPWGLRVMNAVGSAVRAAGVPLLALDESTLLARAARRTGLSDFGDSFFREPLRVLLHAFEHEAALNTLGRFIARTDVVRLLENRLRMTNERKRHREIDAGATERPIFIVGLPRTGTTILHELLAQDPMNRVPMTWEVMHPWPPPERTTYDTDPRIAQVEKHFSGVDRLIPNFKAMHPMGAQLPQECVAMTAHDFASMLFTTTHNVPSYQRWLDESDLRPVYASHRRQLQYLQWRCPAQRWVLKSPGHLWALDALLAVYPDARIVQTHRDPLKVIASLASLVSLLRSMSSDRIDPFAIGAEWTVRLADGLEKATMVRNRLLRDPGQIFDMQFAELVGNEIAMVRRIYAHFGLKLTSDAEARMQRFLAANPRDKHGAHRYTLADAGLDPAAERQRYAAYQERFGIVSERDT